MITKIELTNFMSHAHTVIEPAAGLTVLVGANNVGKSAVVAALQILCHNEKSDFAVRHGEKSCSVRVETDDGHVIQWRRKNSPSYEIDGQTFDRLGKGGTPDELHRALRLPKVDTGSDTEFDVHFGAQKSPIFLLASTGASAARFFASSSDANCLVKMQKLHRDKLASAQKEKVQLEATSRRLNAELELLQPVVDLNRRLEQIEAMHEELVFRESWLKEAAEHEQAMRAQAAELDRESARATVLDVLPPPPNLHTIAPLEDLIANLQTADRICRWTLAQTTALAPLAAPPALADERSLQKLLEEIVATTLRVERGQSQRQALEILSAVPPLVAESPLVALIDALAAVESQVARWQQTAEVVTALPEPPPAVDPRPLSDLIMQWEAAAKQIRACEKELDELRANLAAAAQELRDRAAGGTCSVCGGPLDPDRVVARASLGWGDHDHG